MIEGCCFTNLDDYQHCIWPNKFVAVPRVGDLMEADNGRLLKVVSVTHTQRYRSDGPEIKVELWKIA